MTDPTPTPSRKAPSGDSRPSAPTVVPVTDARHALWLARLRRIRARQVAHNYHPDWEPEAICQMMLDADD